jgi:DNA-binding PadR family transcriptional regulator
MREGWLEVVRTDTKGKARVDWVKITPKGVEFLHANESPIAALRDLQTALQTTREGVPVWLAQLDVRWEGFTQQVWEEMDKLIQRLDALSLRVEEALRRAGAIGPNVPPNVAASVLWAEVAVTYLDRRKENGVPEACPLPELFAAVRMHHPKLELIEFHDGVRCLHDHRVVELTAFNDSATNLPQPEYALIDGARVLYFVSR